MFKFKSLGVGSCLDQRKLLEAALIFDKKLTTKFVFVLFVAWTRDISPRVSSDPEACPLRRKNQRKLLDPPIKKLQLLWFCILIFLVPGSKITAGSKSFL